MAPRKPFERIPWRRLALLLVLVGVSAWLLGWLAGKIVIFFLLRKRALGLA